MVGFHDRRTTLTLRIRTHWLSFLSTSRILLYSLLGSIELIQPRSTAPTQKARLYVFYISPASYMNLRSSQLAGSPSMF